jgi:myo-inositol-1(or 4)-monophosphatase
VSYSAEERLAVEAAWAAVACQRARPSRVDHKGAVDLVTDVDLASEEAIRAVLSRGTPDIPVLGEEGGGAAEARTRWVVDPLDGTTNFVHGLPHYGPSIALEVDGQPVVGVVIDTHRGDVFRAHRGGGAWLGDQRLRVSGVQSLDGALVATGFPTDRRVRAAFYLERVRWVMERCQGIRRAGSAALDLSWLAAGRVDAFWEYDLARWDIAAGRVIVEEAGGRVSALPGCDLGDRPSPLATNGHLHEAFAALFEGDPSA